MRMMWPGGVYVKLNLKNFLHAYGAGLIIRSGKSDEDVGLARTKRGSHRITVEMPDEVMQHLRQASAVLDIPVERVLVQIVSATLPDLHDVPDDVQAALVRLTWLPDEELWRITESFSTEAQQKQLGILSRREAELSPSEREELEALRREFGRLTLLKARAFALLSSRSGRHLLANV